MVVGGGPIGRAFQRALSRETGTSYKVIYDKYKKLHALALGGCAGTPGVVRTFNSRGTIGRCMRRVGVSLFHAMVLVNSDLVVLHVLEETTDLAMYATLVCSTWLQILRVTDRQCTAKRWDVITSWRRQRSQWYRIIKTAETRW